ncbi:LysR family transcriptional regulator [Streptomyces durhamensis]|uniref:LysR family transcriptional regulator n=1 Tax=Streptomyces durhamensis TaxID=68194 RepID=UPI00099CF657|nr:LysR family transcriptional regulator [Streptomyces durhamensis]
MALSTHVPDLAALELLLGVAQEGSLNSVARAAGVSQQAVSARIRAMEAQTGVTLVHRSPRGSSLTAEGVVIAEWAARLLGVAAEMDAGIAALRADRRDRLRVSASLTIAEQLLPGWLSSFRAARRPGSTAPEILLTAINTTTVIAHVADGTADIGFTEGPQRPAGLHGRVVGHDRLAVVVTPGHPWARRRRPVSAAELAAAPLVSREHGSGTLDTLTAALAAVLGPGTPQAIPALSLPTTAAVRAAALAGTAPAVISELAVKDDLVTGRLVMVQTPELDLRRTLRVIWDGASTPPSGAARDLIAHITRRDQPGRTRRPTSGAEPETGTHIRRRSAA